MRVVSILLVLAPTLAACQSVDCRKTVRASVGLDVRDADGAPVLDSEARYRVDGGAWAACDRDDADPDAWFVCGWDERGDFDIEVTAPGYVPWTASTEVERQGCHARSLGYDVVLEPE